MARRIGFNDGSTDTRPQSPSCSEIAPPKHASAAARWLLISFLTIWLSGWTTGIWFAISGLIESGAEDPALAAFLGVWITFALGGWVFVVWVLFRLLAGRPLPQARPD